MTASTPATEPEPDELPAAHLANGRLSAEVEQLTARVTHLQTTLRNTEDAYYEQMNEATRLRAMGAEATLEALTTQIKTEEAHLVDLVARRLQRRKLLQDLDALSDKFIREATTIAESIV